VASNLLVGNDWDNILSAEFDKPYFRDLWRFIEQEYADEVPIYPIQSDILHALRLTPYSSVKVVILGQDPYHGKGQAHGLAFSVQDGVAIPPSLRNIYKELDRINKKHPTNGNLTSWAEKGILLLNTTLTVREAQANSHANKGWEIFTDALIRELNNSSQKIIYLLWGAHAQKKSALITNPNHIIRTAPHPSPLSAHRGFIGCGHFDDIDL
jgi:uracil-DNA glycosylase